MKALVVCHKTDLDYGQFKKTLLARGYEIDLRMGHHDRLVGQDPLEHDLAIFMGGPMGVYQANMFPYLHNEVAYLKERVAADRPTLGVCLGAQMIAKSQDRDVFPGKSGKEIGWLSTVQMNEEGLKTPLRHLDGAVTKMMQWHGDTFNLPEKATLLASSDKYKHQAFSIGKNVIGVQFHPEVNKDIIEFWLATGISEAETAGLTIPQLRQQTIENVEKLNTQCTIFFEEWLDQVL